MRITPSVPRKPQDDPTVRSAMLAARLAQDLERLGFPPGNYWELGIARSIEQDFRTYYAESPSGWLCVEKDYRVRLGLLA